MRMDLGIDLSEDLVPEVDSLVLLAAKVSQECCYLHFIVFAFQAFSKMSQLWLTKGGI